jgi:hypothetical protein
MRFHQLALGQRFEFEGDVYVKTKPMTAVGEADRGERFIRRSADVRPLPPPDGSPAPRPGSGLAAETVLQAFGAFYAHCVRCLDEGALEAGERESIRRRLEEARQQFLDRLLSQSPLR